MKSENKLKRFKQVSSWSGVLELFNNKITYLLIAFQVGDLDGEQKRVEAGAANDA